MSQYSFVRYTSAGSAGPYNVPFPYRDRADVKAYVDDVEALFSWTTSSSITLNNAPAIGAIVEIKRNTSRSARLVQWSSVNQIDADNLETDSLQAFYIAQEAFDAAGEGEQVATAGIEDGAVTNAKLEDMAQNTIKGRVSSGTGDPENLTGTQVAAMLPEFTGASKGLVPASLNVPDTFLRGDGQWAIPAGGGGGGGGGGATISDGDKGDITVSGSGAVWTIDSNSVTFAKMADMDSGSLIYRRTAGSGDPEAQTLATLKTDLGLTGTNSGDQTITLAGDLSGTGTATVTATIQNNAVGLEKLSDVASGSVFYRKTSGTGDPEVQSLATLKTDLGLTGTNTGDQTITLTGDVTGTGTGSFAATIANDSVSNAKLANMANATIKGRTTAGTGDPEDLTAAQATALLDTFTTSLKGLAPASGGGTTNFLRADGQWVAPPAGGGGSQNLFETIAVAGNTSVVADATNDTLTLSAGANMAITTDAANDTITFAVTGLGSLAAKSSIENADVTANAAIAHTKLADITAGQVLMGNGSNVPTATAISGDATLASSGAVTIANNAVSFAKMADIPTNNIVGRVTGGTGDPEDLTADEVITLINTASTNTLNFARLAGAAPTSHNQAWSTITSTPTTLSGYGITDALSNSASSTQTGTFGDIKLRDDTSPSHYLTITDAENLTQDVTLSLNMNNGNRTLSLAGNLTVSGAATVSGTNTGDQTITLTGDVTGTGTGSFAATVAANAVDMTKLADISVNQVIGRVASGTGDPKALTADEIISVINAAGTNTINTARLQSGGFQAANQTLSNIAAQTTSGFFALADNGTPTRVMTAGNGISIANGNGNTGNPTFSVATGDYGDITVSASGATWTIDNDAVTYAKMQNVSATNRLLGRATAGAGDIEELDATAGRTVLGLGTIATQAANNVAIGGGSATLSALTATTATISGGTISGITDLAVADGGTGASNAAGARTNLGVAIGTDVQAYSANLATLSGIVPGSTGQAVLATTTPLGARQALRLDSASANTVERFYDTVAAVQAANIDASLVSHIRTAGYYAAGDGGGALYKKGPSAQANIPASTAANRKYIYSGTPGNYQYWELAAEDTNVLQFGAYNNDTNASATLLAFQGAALFSKSIYIPPGTYLIDGTITVTLDGQRWYGDGFNAAIVKSNSTTLPMFTITEFLNNTVFESFQLTRSGTATSGANGIDLTNKVVGQTRFQFLLVEKQWDGFALSSTDWSEVLDCIAQKNVNNGIYVRNKNTADATSIACQWNITNTLSQMNGARGFFYQSQSGPAGMIVGPLKMCATFANSGVGVGFVGSSACKIYDVRILGGFYGSDGNTAVYVDTYGDQHLIQNCFLERTGRDATGPTLATAASNTGSGLEVTANNDGVIINNVHSYENSLDGMALSATSSVVTGCRCDNNGKASSVGRRNGILLNAGRATITGLRAGNTSGTSQSYGISIADGTNTAIVGADLTGNGVAATSVSANSDSLTIVGSLPNTINTRLPKVELADGTNSAPSLTNAGDTDTGIYWSADNELAIATGGTQRVRVNSTGVGIGNVSPDALLSINGAASFGDGAEATPSVANLGDLNTGMWFPAADNIAFSTGGTRRMRVMDTGSVAIGALNDAPGANDASSTLMTNFLAINTNGMGIGSIGNLSNVLGFATNSAERMRIDASGNVVVGTAALTTNASDGFLYVPTCAGTPTGTPTAFTGRAPIVVNTTNNKLYFYSGGAWRDAGP